MTPSAVSAGTASVAAWTAGYTAMRFVTPAAPTFAVSVAW